MDDILPVADIVRRLKELNPNGVPKCRWNSENKERVYNNIRNWQKANPLKRREHARPSEQRRKARLKGAIGSFTSKEWENLIKAFNYKCAYCKKKKPLTVDHIIPLSKGGTNYINNVIPACVNCNSSKHNNYKDVQLTLQPTSDVSVSRLSTI